MDYAQALEALHSALTFGIDPSLEPITRMCAAMGNPQEKFRCVQVAGTNGKSSVTRMTAAIVRGQGLKTGLYTSPELVRYPERMEIDGHVVSDQDFADAIEAALNAAQACGLQVTEFELLTAGALWLFARESVEVAVLECGLGGRWDATSVCSPQVAVITGIGLDHTRILGNTLEAIAGEKAAIIKPGSTAVLAPGLPCREVFQQQASAVGAPCQDVDAQLAPLFAGALTHMPAYQQQNAAVAWCAAKALLGPIALEDASAALEQLQIPGRFETLHKEPLLLIDAAHNPQSAGVLAQELRRRFCVRGQEPNGLPPIPTLLLGILADKDAPGIVQELCPLFSRIVITKSSSPRALEVEDLKAIVEQNAAARPNANALPAQTLLTAPSIPAALQLLRDEPVVATGSITVAGQVKACWLERHYSAPLV